VIKHSVTETIIFPWAYTAFVNLRIGKKGGTMEYKQITYAVMEGVAVITLNRPEKLNAWTTTMNGEVPDAMARAVEDRAVRAIVLTGEGKGFCAGADMDELEAASQHRGTAPPTGMTTIRGLNDGREVRADFQRKFSYFPAAEKPVIAAVNGPAVGLGLILALYCDLRFASEKAKFSTAFSRRGLIAEYGMSWMLPRIVGLTNAIDLLFSGRLVDAQEAKEIGLVNRVFPESGLMAGVMAYASELAAMVSPRSLRVMKKQIWDAQMQSLAEAIDVADKEMALSIESEDFREGVAHFIEKRLPAFTGK
jgi:enoyl-CoA hydratase/carnithine racemase